MAKSITKNHGVYVEDEEPPPPLPKVPKPYRQGQLDALCGIYTIINGVRNACTSASISKHAIPSGLFADLLGSLEAHGQAQEVICNGMGLRVHERCLRAARDHLSKRNIEMSWVRPWRGKKRLNLILAFKAIQDHIDEPGGTALLRFSTHYYEHWTVVQEVSAGEVKFSDSTGIRMRMVREFEFSKAFVPNIGKRCLIDASSLVLVRIRKVNPDP